jgi:hypothetical protein
MSEVLKVGQRARKIGGSYQALGTIVAEFKTLHGEQRYVFEFCKPRGMLHIFGPSQVEANYVPLPTDGIPDGCHQMTAEDWFGQCGLGFIESDGCGYWATDKLHGYETAFNPKPDWATHVVWFNN